MSEDVLPVFLLRILWCQEHERIKNLKCILLGERSQSEKSVYYMIPMIRHSRKGKTMMTVKRSVVFSGWWERVTDK